MWSLGRPLRVGRSLLSIPTLVFASKVLGGNGRNECWAPSRAFSHSEMFLGFGREKRREKKSVEEHLGKWMKPESGILSPGAQPRSTPQDSRVLAGSRVYQPTREKSML